MMGSSSEFYSLLTHFRELTGVPLLLNFSLSAMGEPIVRCVEDVIARFVTTGLAAMGINDLIVERSK